MGLACNSSAPGSMPLLTELEKRSEPACYRHAAPDGALRRRNKHIPTGKSCEVAGWKACPTGAKWLRSWVLVRSSHLSGVRLLQSTGALQNSSLPHKCGAPNLAGTPLF